MSEMKRGALFTNTRKRDDRSPDVQGDLEIDETTLRGLVAQHKAGQPIKLSIGGYKKTSEKAGEWLSIWGKPFVPRENRAPARPAPMDEEIPF